MEVFKKALKVAITEKVEALRIEIDTSPTLIQYANERSLEQLGHLNSGELLEVIDALIPGIDHQQEGPVKGELSIVNFGDLKLICSLSPRPILFVFIPPDGNQLYQQIWSQLQEADPAKHHFSSDDLGDDNEDAGDGWVLPKSPNAIEPDFAKQPALEQQQSSEGQDDAVDYSSPADRSFNPGIIADEYSPGADVAASFDAPTDHPSGSFGFDMEPEDLVQAVPEMPKTPSAPPFGPKAAKRERIDTSDLPENFDRAPDKKPFRIFFGAVQPDEQLPEVGERPIDPLLRKMIAKGASDVHLAQGQSIIFRIDGDITRVGNEKISTGLMEQLILPIMPKKNMLEFSLSNDTDFSYEIEGLARFRVNVFRNMNGVAAVLRQIPNDVLTLEELKTPGSIRSLCSLNKGLVLVTGPTGSGKSTTLAAMIDYINKQRSEHILTIEDPIEFVHNPQKCLVNQREVHRHTESFSKALRAALREDPDVVMIGEMRDLETVAIAIETAETGHLVFGTLHTNTAISTIDRVIDQFPSDQQEQIRVMLAASLKGVISQTLIKKKGGGRCAAQEILIVDKAVSSLIREGNTHMIQNHMQTQKSKGNILLNEALFHLVQKGVITPESAYAKAVEKDAFATSARQKGISLSSAS